MEGFFMSYLFILDTFILYVITFLLWLVVLSYGQSTISVHLTSD